MNALSRIAVICLWMFARVAAQQHPSMPPGTTHEEHLKARGKEAMGFDQDAATHRFVVERDGGVIEVAANRADDEATRARIRSHLRDIAVAFANGDFSKPLATHGEVPPGVDVMTSRKDRIRYRYGETAGG